MFEKVLITVAAQLESTRAAGMLDNFALIGGLAVSRWSTPRATGDIDLVVRLGSATLASLAAHLHGVARKGSLDDPLLGSIAFEESDENGIVPVQLLQFPPAWERIAFHEVSSVTIADTSIPIVDWKALVLLKLYAGSPLDLHDAKGILAVVSPSERDMEYLRTKANSLRVSRRLAKILPAA